MRRRRILFVCTAYVDRSRTADDLYGQDERYEVRAAGVSPWASVPVRPASSRDGPTRFVMSEEEDRHRRSCARGVL